MVPKTKKVLTKTNHMAIPSQAIRVALTAAGAFLFGDAVANAAEFQQGIGAVTVLASVAWWGYGLWKERRA